MTAVLVTLGVLLLLEVIVEAIYVPIILRQFESQPPFNVAHHPADPLAEPVSTVTRDGLTLAGSLHRGADHQPRGLVLYCPESSGSHWSASWYCEGLLSSGFDVLSFDFRSQGESEHLPGYQPNHWPTRYEQWDLDAAMAFIRSRADLRDLPLLVMGVSRGSLLALDVAARYPEVRAVAGEGTYTVDALLEHFVERWAQLYLPPWVLRLIPKWHLKITLRLVRWTSAWRRGVSYLVLEPVLRRLADRPVLLISGERDNYVPPTIIRRIAKRIDSPRCRIWSVPKAKHNQARDTAREAYDQTLEDFFGQVCPRVSRPQPQPADTVLV